MECNQGQGFTACGVDAMLVVCTYDPAVMGSCLHDSGPCVAGMKKQGSIGECQGRSQYAAHLPSEKETRPTHQYHEARAALSIAVEALCNMTYDSFNDRDSRGAYFQETLKQIRQAAGDIRLTTMQVSCAWCEKPMGDKEGDGSVGETSTICPECFNTQMGKHVPAEVRRIAASIYDAIGVEPMPHQVTGGSPEEFRRTLGEALAGVERREAAEVAPPTAPFMRE